MSLLRGAEKCFANQQIYKPLNAFVRPRDEDTLVQEYTWDIRDADKRRDGGTSIIESLAQSVSNCPHRHSEVGH